VNHQLRNLLCLVKAVWIIPLWATLINMDDLLR
jgi:hypothetical protein